MARLEDHEILARYSNALSNWRYAGYVEWKEIAQEWVRDHLGHLTLRAVAELMYNHVTGGGEIDQVPDAGPAGP